MHPYTITLTPKAPFSKTLLKEYENVINEGLVGAEFRVRLESDINCPAQHVPTAPLKFVGIKVLDGF